MCQSAIRLIENALPKVDDDEKLLRIKSLIAMFIQTMDNWNYSVTAWNTLVLSIFEQYAQLLKKRFSEDFQEIVSTDDYMPMQTQNLDEYDKVINVSWYTPEQAPKYVNVSTSAETYLTFWKLPLCFAFLADVPIMLH